MGRGGMLPLTAGMASASSRCWGEGLQLGQPCQAPGRHARPPLDAHDTTLTIAVPSNEIWRAPEFKPGWVALGADVQHRSLGPETLPGTAWHDTPHLTVPQWHPPLCVTSLSLVDIALPSERQGMQSRMNWASSEDGGTRRTWHVGKRRPARPTGNPFGTQVPRMHGVDGPRPGSGTQIYQTS